MRYIRPPAFRRMQKIVEELRKDDNLSTEGTSQDRWDVTYGYYVVAHPLWDSVTLQSGPGEDDHYYVGPQREGLEKMLRERGFSAGDCVAVYFSKNGRNAKSTPIYMTAIYSGGVHQSEIIEHLDYFILDASYKPPNHSASINWNGPVWF